MENVCQSCLSTDRNLSYLPSDELCAIYKQILKEIHVYDTLLIPQLCWECLALLRNYQRLKQRVKRAQTLLQQETQNCTTLSNLKLHSAVSASFPELEIKDESTENVAPTDKLNVDIKQEEEPNNHTTEVTQENVINHVVVPKKRKTKAKKRKVKTKTAPKRTKKPSISDNEDHSDTNFDNDNFSDEDKTCDEHKTSVTENVLQKVAPTVENQKTVEEKFKTIILDANEICELMNEMRTSDEFVKCNHKCMSCVVSFKNRDLLDIHKKTVHNESSGPHICTYCETRISTLEDLEVHVKSHSTRYECNECGHRLTTMEGMKAHLLQHVSYVCDVCQHFSSSSFLNEQHKNKVHGSRPRCVECGKIFSSVKTYRYHLNVLHKGQNRFPCPHCSRVYQWKSNLWRHIKNHKAQDTGELYCSECDKKFSSVATYRQHLRISRRHVPESQFDFTCDECGKKFVNKTKLKDHVDWEHLNKTNYKCRLCAKAFRSHTSLYVHLHNVHRNKEEKDNLCHVCGKSYQSTAKLKYHISAMHSAGAAYTCTECGAAFSWYSSLYRHVRQAHAQVKPMKRPKKIKCKEDTSMMSHPPQLAIGVMPVMQEHPQV